MQCLIDNDSYRESFELHLKRVPCGRLDHWDQGARTRGTIEDLVPASPASPASSTLEPSQQTYTSCPEEAGW